MNFWWCKKYQAEVPFLLTGRGDWPQTLETEMAFLRRALNVQGSSVNDAVCPQPQLLCSKARTRCVKYLNGKWKNSKNQVVVYRKNLRVWLQDLMVIFLWEKAVEGRDGSNHSRSIKYYCKREVRPQAMFLENREYIATPENVKYHQGGWSVSRREKQRVNKGQTRKIIRSIKSVCVPISNKEVIRRKATC